jgi:hypothetical protein
MSVYDGKRPYRNPEPWPEGRVPTNNLERLIASAPRPPTVETPAPIINKVPIDTAPTAEPMSAHEAIDLLRDALEHYSRLAPNTITAREALRLTSNIAPSTAPTMDERADDPGVNIKTWKERLFEQQPELRAQYHADCGALDEIGCWIKDEEIADLRAALAAKPATREVALDAPLYSTRQNARRYQALVGAAHAHCTGAKKTPEQQAVHDAIKHLGEKHGIELLGAAIDAAIAAEHEDQP